MRDLSPGELTSMQHTQNALLPDTGVIHRPTGTSDGMGGTTQAYALVATEPCRLSPRNVQPADSVVAGRPENAMGWNITFRAGTDIRVTDRIVINGRTFEVDKPLKHALETVTRVIATEIV